MIDLKGIDLSLLSRGEEEVFLCYECLRGPEQNGRVLKLRCGSRKFLTTAPNAGGTEGIRLLIWKNCGKECLFRAVRPEITIEKDFVKIDLEKEFAALGLIMYEGEEFNSRYLRSRSSVASTRVYGVPIAAGTNGFYYTRHTWSDCDRYNLYFRFAHPGVKLFRNRVKEIEIDTFDGISRMDAFYAFVSSVLDGALEPAGYSEEKLTELIKEHLPETMFLRIVCEDRILRAGIDHLGGEPRRWVEVYKLENGKRTGDHTERIASEDPLESVIGELKLSVRRSVSRTESS